MIVAVMQCRMGSKRLPGKMLLDLNGKSVLLRVIERIKQCKNIDKIIVTTTNNKSDDVIVGECSDIGIHYFRGSEDNVLGRFYHY